MPGGVAVELVHNFSLLHDDLMDGDETRRHRATAWTVFGPAQAILVGDALATLGTEVLLDAATAGGASPTDAARAVRLLTTATRRLIDGQAMDVAFEQRDSVTVAECLEMEGGKTAALLAAASAIGAVLAGADDRVSDALQRYGHHLGLAFQAVDDLLGIWGPPRSPASRTGGTSASARSPCRSPRRSPRAARPRAGSPDSWPTRRGAARRASPNSPPAPR